MLAEFIDPAILGFILVGVMLFAIFVGFPISFTLIFLGFSFGYLGFGHLVFYLMTLQFSMVMTEQALAAVPLFIFMGIMMEQAGLMERLFSAFQLMLAKVRGSLYYAVLFVSVIFAAATGIVGASVTILGIMAAKSMNKSGYDIRLSAGTITAGGTLGILIPPSIMLVVMGPIMEIPVTDLFAAAIIPGILLETLYAAYTTIRCWINPSLGPVLPEELRATSIKAVWIEFFLGLVPPAALVFAALGSILFGFATPTEAAGMGAMGSLILALAYRKLSFKKLQGVLVKTLEISALIMVLVAASNFFGSVFSRLGTPMLITEVLLNLEMNRYVILAIVMLMIFLLGWPLEWVPIVMIIIPIILPFIEAIRQFSNDVKKKNSLFIHLTLVPYLKASGELKTKPTQHSVKELRSLGIQPDIIICRSEREIPKAERKKISLFCNVSIENVIETVDVRTIYEAPISFHKEKLDDRVLSYFNIKNKKPPDLTKWKNITSKVLNPIKDVNICIIGIYVNLKDAYKSLDEALIHGGISNNLKVNLKRIDSEHLRTENVKPLLKDVSGILIPGGFGKRGSEGKIAAIKYARLNNIPFFGICFGMQMAIIEAARNLLNIKNASTSEFGNNCTPVVGLLEEWQKGKKRIKGSEKNLGGTMRLGLYEAVLKNNSLISKIYTEKKNQRKTQT